MDEKKQIELTPEEEKEFRDGSSLYEMDQTNAGWQIVKDILKDLAFHSWVDPRTCENEKEFVWRETNGFHAANNAKELLETIEKLISRSQYLGKKKSGEVPERTMRI